MEQVLKAKSRSSKASPLPSPSSIVPDERKRKRRSEEGENSGAIVGETPTNPSSGPTGVRNKPPAGKVYCCKTCGREYESYHALGGHQNVHKVQKDLEKLQMKLLYGLVTGSLQTGYGPVHYNPPLYHNGPFMERLYGIPQPLVAPRVPTHGPPGFIPGWGSEQNYYPNDVYGSCYGGESSTGNDPTRDSVATEIGSSRSEGGDDGAPRDDDDDDNGEGDRQEIDLTLKI